MSDLQKMKDLFNELGIEFIIKEAEVYFGEKQKTVGHDGSVNCDTVIEINNGVGYSCFWTDFYFLDGVFQGHGCWE